MTGRGKLWRRLLSALRFGVRGVCGAPLVFVASVGTMSAGLVLIAAYLLLAVNMHAVLEHFGRDLRLVAFLEPGAAPAPPELDRLRERLEADAAVAEVVYVAPDAALERLRADLGREAAVLDSLERNPLPGSFEVRLHPGNRAPEELSVVAARLDGESAIAEVRYGEDWAEGYARVLRAVDGVGLGLGALLLIVLCAIVAGTVRLAVHARAHEIQIQRLVGADGWFVRVPFCLEGGLQGAAAAGLALAVLWGMFQVGVPLLRAPLALVLGPRDPVFFGPGEIGLLLALGVALGLVGALLSLVRLEESS